MTTPINFSQATNAYSQAAGMQRNMSASLEESPHLPGETPSMFKPNFQELVTESLDKARDAKYEGESQSLKSLANEAEYHELVTAVNNAELSLRTVVAMRDKLLNAYHDIIKMPI